MASPASSLASNLEVMDTWSLPLLTTCESPYSNTFKQSILTSGHTQGLARVMLKVAMVTGLKSRSLGYMSSGDSVYNWWNFRHHGWLNITTSNRSL